MCRGESFPKWQAKCIEKLLELPGVKLSLIIIDENYVLSQKQKIKKPLIRKILSKVKSLLFGKYIGRLYMEKLKIDALQNVDLMKLTDQVPKICCSVIKKGRYSEYFSKEDIEKVAGYNLDFILRFTFNILRGEILNVPRYGVWSFHHDDEQAVRGGPPCFWEVYYGHDATGSILQKLNDELDAGVVLRKGFFNTIQASYAANFNNALLESTEWPRQACKDILNGNVDYFNDEPSKSSAPIYYSPTNLQMIRFFITIVKNRLLKKRDLIFRKREIWNIGIVNRPISCFLNGEKPDVFWLKDTSKDKFAADPFGFMIKDKIHILFEDYDYRACKGIISEIQLNDYKEISEADIKPAPVLIMDTHMSYPYVFNYEEDIYCIPETGDAGEVSLHKYNKVTGNWDKVKILLSGMGFIDSTVFYFKDLWWLFCTLREKNPVQNLFAWYCKDLFGTWSEHKNNPVKMDIRSARPAGTPFYFEGSLYRPAQDCSKDYGHNVAINKIIKLTPLSFKEEEVAFIAPFDKRPYNVGFHTISSVGNMTLVDGRKDKIFFDLNGLKLYRIAKKLYRKIFQ